MQCFKRGQKGVFPKSYTRNCNRLLILIIDWGLIKIEPQEKKMSSRGYPMGSQEVGLLMLCYFINRPPLSDPLTSFFSSVDSFLLGPNHLSQSRAYHNSLCMF